MIDAKFANNPESVANSINDFITFCRNDFEPKAVYLEMIGFDINYEYWIFDFFGFKEFFPLDEDLDWLSDWQSDSYNSVELTGMEHVHEDFRLINENPEEREKVSDEVRTAAILLVMVRFVELIGEAFATGKIEPGAVILCTAHDFDIIGRFE